uniref:Uncharacterized protein n=1 Tax=Panagrolaimus sp. ES5 TaxID=591445 RepID=A0AC34FDV0_9BILA
MSSPKKSESECTEAAPAITNNAIEDDPFISFQELIGDALNSSTVAATKMIQVMAEVFTQQQQILNLQIQNQEILKDNQQLLKKIEHSHQKLLSQESSHKHRQVLAEEKSEEVFMKTESESPSSPKRSRTNEEERRRKKRARNDPLCAQLSPLLEALIEYKDRFVIIKKL